MEDHLALLNVLLYLQMGESRDYTRILITIYHYLLQHPQVLWRYGDEF